MAYYQIKDIGKVGVVTDLSPTDLPPNAFTDAINARFVGSQITKFGGNKPISYNGAEDNITAFAIQPMPFDFQYDHPFNILGTADGLYLLEDQHWENISYWEAISSSEKTANVSVTSHPLMTAIVFDENQAIVRVGKTHDLRVTLKPEGVKKQDLTWSVADAALGSIAVDPADPLHAVFTANNSITGLTTVNVSNKDGSLTNFIHVSVVPNVDQLSINQDTFSIRRSTDTNNLTVATAIFNPAVSPDLAKDITWITSDTSVFTVQPQADGSCKLAPGRVGSADLTVQMNSAPSIKGKARVTVLPGVTRVDLSRTTLNLSMSSTVPEEVTVSMFPATAPDKSFTVAKVQDGSPSASSFFVTGNSIKFSANTVGRDIVQVIANDGGVIGSIQITVTQAANPAPPVQDDFVDDVINVGTVSLFSLPAAPPTPKVNLVPKPVDGPLHFTTNLSEKYAHPYKDNFNIEIMSSGGVAPVTYKWYKNGVEHTSFNPETVSVNYSDITASEITTWQVEVSDGAGHKITSNLGTVYIYDKDAPQTIVSVSLDKDVIDFNQGDVETVKATVQTSNGNTDNLIYYWEIKKNGVVTHDELDQDEITLYGLDGGTTTVTFHVWATRQRAFHVTPDVNWYHTAVANCAVFNTNTFQPMVKEFGEKYFKILPGWGQQTLVDNDGNWSVKTYNWTCERIRAFNNRLFALNTTEPDVGGVERHYPQRIRWSNFATENKAPSLWDDLADLRDSEDSNNAEGTLKALVNGYAGYIDLADTQGDLMEMLPLKDYLFVYTEFETYVGTPTMNAYQPMTFKKLYNDSGILAPNCVVEVEGGHFVVTQNDVILHNGATKQSIANSIVKDKIIEEVSAVNPAATRVYLHSDKKEVWICYVGHGFPKNTWYNTKAAVWNYEFQTWTFYELPLTYEIVLSDPPTLDKTATWEDFAPGGKMEFTWEDIASKKMPWQKNFLNFRKRITLGCSAMKGLYQLDIGSYNWASVKTNDPALPPYERPLKMIAERKGIDFDNITEDWSQKHINSFNFQVNGTGNLNIEVGGTQFSNEKGHEHNYRPYIAGRTRKLSVRLNHPYLYYGIVDEDPTSDISVSGLVIDFALGGKR